MIQGVSIIHVKNLHNNINFEEIGNVLKELFLFKTILYFDFVHGGYMSQNFRVETDRGTFFLKQYRNRINTIIHEIKEAETFFASQGIPVIEPIKDIYHREAFWSDGYWLSLFPFIHGQSPVAGKMNPTLIRNIASMLATIHIRGKTFKQATFQTLRLSTPRKFHLEQAELLRILKRKEQKNPLETRMTDVLKMKALLTQHTKIKPEQLNLDYDNLLHGDYQYYNLFVNQRDEITHVYDFERACLGPIEYEVCRSVMLNCFDDGREQRNFDHARLYLQEYHSRNPLIFEKFKAGMELYAYNILHMTWIEARYLIFGIDTQIDLFNRHVDRVEFFAETDLEHFCRKIFPK